MGTKGDRLTSKATESVERLLDEFAALGDITHKAMFGGYGIFESGVMFVLIDSAGTPHFRVDDTTQYVDVGSTKHSRMPYWSIPSDVLDDHDTLLAWAGQALEVARPAKKK